LVADLGEEVTSESIPIPNINSSVISKVIEWCNHHKNDHPSTTEYDSDSHKKITDIEGWDQIIMRVHQEMPFEIIPTYNELYRHDLEKDMYFDASQFSDGRWRPPLYHHGLVQQSFSDNLSIMFPMEQWTPSLTGSGPIMSVQPSLHQPVHNYPAAHPAGSVFPIGMLLISAITGFRLKSSVAAAAMIVLCLLSPVSAAPLADMDPPHTLKRDFTTFAETLAKWGPGLLLTALF
jgi:hypothetical protein